MNLYGDSMCATDASVTVPLDNGCHSEGPGGFNASNIELLATPPAGPFCPGLAIAPGTGDAGPVGPKTLCCP